MTEGIDDALHWWLVPIGWLVSPNTRLTAQRHADKYAPHGTRQYPRPAVNLKQAGSPASRRSRPLRLSVVSQLAASSARGLTMLSVKQLLQGTEPDRRTAGLLAGGACVAGALAVLVSKFNNHRQVKAKIQRARDRRTESLRRAEEAVLRYNKSVRVSRDGNMNIGGLLHNSVLNSGLHF